jgi:hypothetical protein
MLVLAINVVYTYFNSIDFHNRQKLLTQIQRIRQHAQTLLRTKDRCTHSLLHAQQDALTQYKDI